MNLSRRDPVCGMTVQPGGMFTADHEGTSFSFCSEPCRRTFAENPRRFALNAAAALGAQDPMSRRIAYFSMEVGVESKLPTYSGGLGILAGDTLKSFADLALPVVGVSLLYSKGYFTQKLDEHGNQSEEPTTWSRDEFVRPLPATVTVPIEGRSVIVQAWIYPVRGIKGHVLPLILLDTSLEANAPRDRELTASLYGGDERYRLSQEVILGIGGVRMLRALGYKAVERFHMNEGHAALLTLELLREQRRPPGSGWDLPAVREQCVFTTHTPVPAGHDQFSYGLVKEVLGDSIPIDELQQIGGEDKLNMTLLALNLSHYVNGVAKRHGEVSQEMFPGYSIDSITNGVHSLTWTCDSFRKLFNKHIPGWSKDPFGLRYAISIPNEEIWQAHTVAKARLIAEVNRRNGPRFREDLFTLGFARRTAKYKRHDLIFENPEELRRIAREVGPIQLIFAGKAHPHDNPGRDVIKATFDAIRMLQEDVKITWLENYDMALGRLLTSGVDVWLNTPLRPLEASGTSGMKAAHNGVPSLSILDGWWVEGHVEGVTGWSIGPAAAGSLTQAEVNIEDARDLYLKLSTKVLPTFYKRQKEWVDIMRFSIAFNASFFNTHRMAEQYAANAYL